MDWLASGFTLASVLMLRKKLPSAHLVAVAGALIWIGHSVAEAQWALAVLNAVFIALGVWNYVTWRKDAAG